MSWTTFSIVCPIGAHSMTHCDGFGSQRLQTKFNNFRPKGKHRLKMIEAEVGKFYPVRLFQRKTNEGGKVNDL